MKSLRRLFTSPKPRSAPRPGPTPGFRGGMPKPEEAFVAIGDIHGCADNLDRLWEKIDAMVPGMPVVHVGDYVDRGEHSAQVLKMLFDRQRERGDIACLMGNHEEMFLEFLDKPEKSGERWLRYGGLQTVASFGPAGDAYGRKDIFSLRDAVIESLGQEQLDWLRGLPLVWSSGNMSVVHAGADPRMPLDEQPERNLTWGHQDFGHLPRRDGLWIVHGHTIVQVPQMANGVISIDTGAYATDRLTAAIIRPEREVEFIQATSGQPPR
ncbi:metallophosphoesterase family protein [Martelella radicis]|uniref:Serine/threonine protein phosphatase 1 n=1 Tax=Martelella radicis TaxID=1397476 RepID=A0A7W6PA11_9HYPH|nr:metallophosphoesterase family protein [Martelella radicis]MBB4120942.1 serine/threonine protein phosphatase 1 [Martelella radicis]